MKKIILTCFQQFGPYRANSSELVAQNMNGGLFSGYRIDVETFPATIPKDDRGQIVFKKAHELRANGIVCLGMGSERKGPSIESQTANRVCDWSYCPPELNRTPIDSREPYGKWFELDIKSWNIPGFSEACAREHIHMDVSKEPGGFCCNHLLYQMRRVHTADPVNTAIPWIYLHLPCTEDCVASSSYAEFGKAGKVVMALDKMVRSVELLLKTAELPN